MNKFILTISLSNDAMQTPEDVAEALRVAASRIESYALPLIFDLNGNTVGSWEFTS